jgi:MFS family permease
LDKTGRHDPGARNLVLVYMFGLMLLVGFGNPGSGLINVPVSFFLKNRLHLPAHDVANFQLVAAVPLYLGFLFGFARDRWDILGRKDRGMLMVFGTVCAAAYAAFAFLPASYPVLMAGMILAGLAFQFAYAAREGVAAMAGQQLALTGAMSVLWSICASVPYLGAYLLGGYLSQALEGQNAELAARILFLVGAAVMLTVALYALWGPKRVFGALHREEGSASSWGDVARIARHWPVYPALAIWFLWSFAPGSATPLQYYMQNTLHATDAQWGEWNAIFAAGFIPTYLVYGALVRWVTARTLFLWTTIVGVPQFVPLYFIHSVDTALIAAALIGLLGGACSAAFIDLLIRSCPRGLQGTTMMFSASLYWVAIRFGDVLGTQLYDRFGGFATCVLAITVTYAAILPLLLLVPKDLVDTKAGERPPEGDFTEVSEVHATA